MNPALDAHARYESIMSDMSRWIQEQTWGGHEKGCPRFAADVPGCSVDCTCIQSVLHHMYQAIADHDRAVRVSKAAGDGYTGLPDFAPIMMDLQARITQLDFDAVANREHLEELELRLQMREQCIEGLEAEVRGARMEVEHERGKRRSLLSDLERAYERGYSNA
jgi:uncharacterized coiled-coil protein SlyX